jgi:hypothetical protein
VQQKSCVLCQGWAAALPAWVESVSYALCASAARSSAERSQQRACPVLRAVAMRVLWGMLVADMHVLCRLATVLAIWCTAVAQVASALHTTTCVGFIFARKVQDDLVLAKLPFGNLVVQGVPIALVCCSSCCALHSLLSLAACWAFLLEPLLLFQCGVQNLGSNMLELLVMRTSHLCAVAGC